jgi:hypothetical protein
MPSCNLDLLPKTARELVDLIGLPAFQLLLEWRGGCYFNVPVRFGEQYELCRVLSREAVDLLIGKCAGEQISLPRCAASARAEVWKDVVRRRRSGEPEVAVARAYGYTARWVRDILRRAGAEEEEKQGRLGFD